MNITKLPETLTKPEVEALRKAFGYFYDQGKTSNFKDPDTGMCFKDAANFIDELWKIGIPKETSIKYIGITLENWYETLQAGGTEATMSGAPEYAAPSNTLTPGQLKQFQEEDRIQKEKIKQTQVESKQAVQTAIKRQQEIYAEQIQKVKTAEAALKNQKIYYKVGKIPVEETQEIKNLKQQAEADPKKFVEDAAKQFENNPNLKNLTVDEAQIVSGQAAVTTYDILTDNSPVVQAAVINKLVSDPALLNKIVPNLEDQKTLKDLASILVEQKTAQFELANQFINLTKIDGLTNFENIAIKFSDTPKEGFREFDFNQQIISPSIENLNQQSLLLDRLKGFGEGEIKSQILQRIGTSLDGQIAKLPANGLLAKAYNSDVVQLGLSSLGIVEAAPWVAAEGSWIGRIAVGSGFGPVAGFMQAKTGINLGVKLAVKTGTETAIKAGTTTAVKTGFKAVFSKVTAALGSAGGPIGTALAWLGGELLVKVAEKIPWKKIKEWSAAILGGITGLIALPFLGLGSALGIGLGTTAISAAFGGGLGGLTLAGFGRGIGNFFGALAGATLGAIGKPILITLLVFPLIVALILFIINSGAYIVPPSSLSYLLGQDNPYISVTKVANPSKIGNPSGKQTVTYTVTITAIKGPLTNIKILSTSCNVIKKNKSNAGCPVENIPDLPAALSISPASPYSFTFSSDFGPNLSDSLIFDSIKISADAVEKQGVSTSGSETVCVGDCPLDCIKTVDNAVPWPGNLRSNVEAAAASLSGDYPNFVAKVCSSGKEVNLCYNPPQISAKYFAWHVHTDSCDVYFNQKGLNSERDALFLVTHEITHHVQKTNGGSVQEYSDSGGFNELHGNGFCTYSDTAGSITEAMAEAAGLYVSIPSWGGCVTNYGTQYPRNYIYAKGFME